MSNGASGGKRSDLSRRSYSASLWAENERRTMTETEVVVGKTRSVELAGESGAADSDESSVGS